MTASGSGSAHDSPASKGAGSAAERFSALSSEQRVRLMRRLVDAGQVAAVPAVVPPRDAEGPAPLSPAQEDLWVYESLYPGTPALNLCSAYHFDRPVEASHLEQALRLLLRRHDILRARITGEPPHLQLSFPPVGEFTLEREDLRGAGRGIESAFEAFRRRPFDLARDRLFRARLVTVDDSRCTLMLNLHHIITDWWSFDVLQGELAEAYRAAREGQAPRLSRPRIQYADFAAWQAELDASGVFGKRLEFWRRYLAQPPGALTVPGAPADAAEGIAQAVFQIDAGAAEAVRALARERNASVYVVLMAAFAVLAHRLSGAEDMVLGTPTANRSATGLERVMGYVMNAVPTRWRIRPDDSFGAVLARFLADFPDVMANADVPVGRIVSAAAPERRAGRSPLFQWVFMHLVPERSLRSLQEFAAPERIHTGGEHDLVGIVWDRDDGMEVSFEVRTEVFSAPVAARWAQAFAELLRQVAAAPEAPVSRHDLTPHAERARLLALSTGPAAPPWESLPDMLARHATATPDAPALVSGEVTLTYAQLVDRVDRLAGVLAQHAAAAERVVALALGRSAGFVIAALATLRAGAAYLPIDLDHPAEHLRHMLRETDPVLLVADREAELPTNVPTLLLDQRQILAGLPCEPLAAAPTLRADRAAYVIYTSGSTGRPKGVVVAHAGIPGLAHSFAERFGLGASDRILQHGSPGFDISVGEIAMAIASGAALVVAPPGPLAGPELGELLTSERVSFALLPPSVLGSVPDGDFPALRGVAVGAEVCPPGLVARWSASGRRFCNAYGPTESTVAAAVSEALVADGTAPPIGAPVAGARTYVLDARLRPAPVGVRGELYLAGDGLARGYLGQSGMTAERFVADPHGPPGARMYRTGDFARWREDGSLDYLGRADDQVKLRGVRIEPGHVAAVLAEHPAVAQAVAMVREDLPGRPQLVGYVARAGVEPVTPDVLLRHAATRLPLQMMPSHVVVLDALPLTPNGKIDRAALPAPEAPPAAGQAPASAREELLCGLFAQVLGVERVGAGDDFFRLGGDSIMAIQLAGRALATAGLTLTPRDVFVARTPAQLALAAQAAPAAAAAADTGVGRLPLTPIMHWWREAGGDQTAFTQSMIFPTPAGVPVEWVRQAVQSLVDQHGTLRMRLRDDELEVAAPGAAVELAVDAPTVADLDQHARELAADVRLDPCAGEMLRAVFLDPGDDRDGRLLLTVHHFAVDGVSWRLLGPQLADALAGKEGSAAPGTSFLRWSESLHAEARRPERAEAEPGWWQRALAGPDARIRTGPAAEAGARRGVLFIELAEQVTSEALGAVPAAFNCGADAVLLTALVAAAARWRGESSDSARAGAGLLVNLESHGREVLAGAPDVDVSGAVGWFTTQHPVRLDPGRAAAEQFWDPSRPEPGDALKLVKEQLRAVPDAGLGWGLLRYLNPDTAPTLAALAVPDLSFNYLGRFSGDDAAGGELLGTAEDGAPLRHAVEIDAIAVDRDGALRLAAAWSYAQDVLTETEVRRLADLWQEAIGVLAAHAGEEGAGGHTASDFALVDLSQDQLAMLERGL